jgi:nucleotide-binding universal stress UspA family protein
VGVDPQQPVEAVVRVLRMLAPQGLEAHLVYVLPPRSDKADLAEARAVLEIEGLGGTWIRRSGDPAQALIATAEDQGADLIAIGAPAQGRGHVAKALLSHSPVSLLIAKAPPKRPEGLVAVLATDHSDYMDACIDRFVGLRPGGLKEIVVLTANEVVVGTAALLVQGLGQFAEKAEQWMAEKIEEENRRIAQRFVSFCPCTVAVARNGEPNEVFHRVLREYDADLLIMGARRHCTLERLLFGSLSFDEVVDGEHSVLALRCEPEPKRSTV